MSRNQLCCRRRQVHRFLVQLAATMLALASRRCVKALVPTLFQKQGSIESFHTSLRAHIDKSSLFDSVISSSQSATVKRIQAIMSKRKKRHEYEQTVVEGPRMVFDLLQDTTTAHLVRQVLISEEDYSNYEDRLQELPDSIAPHIQIVTPSILKACTDTVSPQGIVSLVDIPVLRAHTDSKFPFYLVLDGVSDPGNVGTLLRSALAVGVSGVLLLPGCCDVWNPKAVRSSMGASFKLPIIDCSDWESAVDVMVQQYNVRKIYGATMMEEVEGPNDSQNSRNLIGGASQAHFDIEWLSQPSAVVIGSEGAGLSVGIRDTLEGRFEIANGGDVKIGAVHVPMQAGIESLNAAVCGSVIMFEYSRQCEQQSSRVG